MIRGKKLLATAMALGTAVAFSLVGGATAAHASGGNVTVSLSSVSPQETVSITSLTGQDLTTAGLSLGADNPLSNSLAAPFEVTVADSSETPSAFNIEASMTNLYFCGTSGCTLPGTAPTGDEVIPSNDVSVSYPASDLDVEDVTALVAPLFTVAGSIPATICAAAALLNTSLSSTSCGSISDQVVGVGQEIAQTVDDTTAGLNDLPIIPEQGATGNFATADFDEGAVTYGGSPSIGTALSVVSGGDNTASSVLSSLGSEVDGAGGSLTAATDSYLDSDALQSALRSTLDTDLGVVNTGTTDLGDPVWDELVNATPADLTTVESGLGVSLVGLGSIGSCLTSGAAAASCVAGVSGDYHSFPILNVSVPSGTPDGNFEGSLVFTGF